MNSCLSSLLLFYLLAPLHVIGAEEEYIPFEQNYTPLWGPENLRILNQRREAQLTLDQHSGNPTLEKDHVQLHTRIMLLIYSLIHFFQYIFCG